jgi:hypothetical protein
VKVRAATHPGGLGAGGRRDVAGPSDVVVVEVREEHGDLEPGPSGASALVRRIGERIQRPTPS